MSKVMPYSDAIAWVALNDDPHEQCEETVRGTLLCGFLADVYRARAVRVAKHIVDYRKAKGYAARDTSSKRPKAYT